MSIGGFVRLPGLEHPFQETIRIGCLSQATNHRHKKTHQISGGSTRSALWVFVHLHARISQVERTLQWVTQPYETSRSKPGKSLEPPGQAATGRRKSMQARPASISRNPKVLITMAIRELKTRFFS